jgi:diguanylate cyclase (GGDEF)-like protein/PAS domain S-box-containing protein
MIPQDRWRTFSRLAAAGAAAIAGLALAGWIAGSRALERIAVHGPLILPIEALASILAALALWLLATIPSRARPRQVLALLVIAIGLVALVEAAFGLKPSIDHLFFHDPSGRMTAAVAAGFVLIGVAVGWSGASLPGIRLSELLALATGSIGLVGVLGYATQVHVFERLGAGAPVALPVALTFMLLAAGFAAARPHEGISRLLRRGSPGGLLARNMLPLAVLLPLVLALVVSLGQRSGLYGPRTELFLMTIGVVAVLSFSAVRIARRLDRADAERAGAERANRKLAAIVEQTDDAVIVTTRRGIVTEWNAAAERLYGYSAEEIIGRPTSVLMPAEREQEGAQLLRDVLAGEAIPQFETIRLRKDGTALDVQITLSPMHDELGRIVGTSAIARDISARKQAVTALIEAEERFRGAFDEAPIGMAMLDLAGSMLKTNEALCQIVGYSREQLEGQKYMSISQASELAADRQAAQALLAGERPSHSAEKLLIHAAGYEVNCAVQATLVRDADGEARHFIVQVQDLTESKRQEEQLTFLAEHDALTGLLNRRAFMRELEAHSGLQDRYGLSGTVMIIDLDHFKFLNDTLGPQAGDELLFRFALLLSDQLDSSDVIARVGGDEFGVLLPKADGGEALQVARKLLGELRGGAINVDGNRRLTASIGLATFEDRRGVTADEMIVDAELAMYDAKEGGRDRTALFGSEHYAHAPTPMKGRVTWAQRVSSALDEDRFTLLAQPIIDFHTGRVAQYELLLRMTDDRGDLIPPGPFLSVAERLDLIHQIDAWVVASGIQLLTELGPEGKDVAVEINLSGRSLGEPELLDLIDTELRNARVSPERIIFEVTETAAISSIAQARAFGDQLSEIGCRFALDDFGAGFGSFYYLKHLMFDFLKIDGEFVRDCRADHTDQLVIQAVVDIARGMGKRTIAEFVGDDETAKLLARMGVDYGQGYHLGIPAPLGEQLTHTRHATRRKRDVSVGLGAPGE